MVMMPLNQGVESEEEEEEDEDDDGGGGRTWCHCSDCTIYLPQ
jgi:hypothetical protein